MSYGLRRYETLHRLWWFFFFFLCLFFARYSDRFTHFPPQSAELKDLGKIDFWTGLQGIGIPSTSPQRSGANQNQPDRNARSQTGKTAYNEKGKQSADEFHESAEVVSEALLFIIRAGIIFLELRILWLLIQYAGRFLLQLFLSESEEDGGFDPEPSVTRPETLFAAQSLAAKITRNPLSYVLHPFIRLRLMLSSFRKNVSSEELFEKERRVVDSDWRILNGSWAPYRLLFWIVPVLGVAQTLLLLISQLNAASAGIVLSLQKDAVDAAKPMLGAQKEILDAVKPAFNLLLPMIQAAGAAIFFQVAATLLRHFEDLYLFNLDSFIFDRVLSRLPLRSNDTILILEAIHKQFRDLSAAFKRLENKLFSITDPEN